MLQMRNSKVLMLHKNVIEIEVITKYVNKMTHNLLEDDA